MDLDVAPTGGRTLVSLALAASAVSQSLALKRHNRRAPHKPDRPRRTPRPQQSSPGRLGDLTPTRSFTRPVKVESLRVYEGAGHTLARHVNHAPNADVERLERERDIPASGSFTSEALAQRAVEAAISANTDGILNWLGTRRANGPFVADLDMGEPIGSVLTRAQFNAARKAGQTPVPAPVSSVRIVLRRSDKFEGGFFVLTAYPIPGKQRLTDIPPISIEPLARYEGPGHTLARHVTVTPAELVERLGSETEITAASRFIDEAVAQRAVERAVAERAAEIHNWQLSGTRMPFSGDVSLDETVGVVLTRKAFESGRLQPVPANRVHFVLVRSDAYAAGFYVKTAYPVVPW